MLHGPTAALSAASSVTCNQAVSAASCPPAANTARSSAAIRCRSGAIITPAARDALAATDVILRYEGETTHAAS